MSWKIERRHDGYSNYACNDRYFILDVVCKGESPYTEVIDEKLQKYRTVWKEYEYEVFHITTDTFEQMIPLLL